MTINVNRAHSETMLQAEADMARARAGLAIVSWSELGWSLPGLHEKDRRRL